MSTPDYQPDKIYHPERADLLGRLLEFSRTLRQAGAGTSKIQTISAAKSLMLIDLSNPEDFRNALRTTLVSTRDGLAIFDYYFNRFFSLGPDRTPPAPGEPGLFGPDSAPTYIPFRPEPAGDEDNRHPSRPLAVGASLAAPLARRDLAALNPSEEVLIRRLVHLLSRQLAVKLKRRFAFAVRAEQLDFRRTFRHALNSGGELVDLRYRGRRPRRPRLVVIGDVSASMEVYTNFFLDFMHGLATVLPRTEVFIFSTKLARLTPYFRRTPPERLIKSLTATGLPFSGGTTIGLCLMDLLRHWAGLLNRRTTVFILSDGWDRGDPAILAQAMRLIKTRTQAIYWLNPLAAAPDFLPLAQGIKTALPYLTALLPFARLTDISSLSRLDVLEQ